MSVIIPAYPSFFKNKCTDKLKTIVPLVAGFSAVIPKSVHKSEVTIRNCEEHLHHGTVVKSLTRAVQVLPRIDVFRHMAIFQCYLCVQQIFGIISVLAHTYLCMQFRIEV